MKFFHGGKAGLGIGDRLVPAPPHVDDGCPICLARRQGRVFTVGEYRAWLLSIGGQQAERVLAMLEGAPDSAPVDPPSAKSAVYITTDREYALFYAARSRGDLYEVRPCGAIERTTEDHFPSWTASEAVITAVLRRKVQLTRTERRRILHRWKKADARAARTAGNYSESMTMGVA